jgi:hypothetical protein
MSVRLTCLELWTPVLVRRWMLDELTSRVAGGFDRVPPRWSSSRYRDRLAEFARFTDEESRRALADTDATPIAGALRAAAAEMGADLRRRLAVRTPAEGARALRLLYRHIGIDLDVFSGGRVQVSGCLFASSYSPSVCALMGSVDDGIAAGLLGSGLTFTERLTEGASACHGRLTAGAS